MNIDFDMPARVFSGKGCIEENMNILNSFGKKCIIVTGGKSALLSGALDDCTAALSALDIQYSVFDKITPNPTTQSCFEGGRFAAAEQADFIVGIGGGSALDAAKAIAIYAKNQKLSAADIYNREYPAPALPVVLIGTTAGTGSEVTGVSVLTNSDSGRKKSISGADCYAALSFCDYRYTLSAPFEVYVSTALDAFSHACESYLSSSANCISDMFALEAIRELYSFIVSPADDIPSVSRERIYYASVYAGFAINKSGTAFPHTVGYYLTENYRVPHGRACAVFLPLLFSRAKKYYPDKLRVISEICGCSIEKLGNAVKNTAAVKVKISEAEADAAAVRWCGKIRNFERSPGGFSAVDAKEALISI